VDGGDPGGGSAALAGLINQFGEELDADFLRYYHLDLTDVLVPGTRLTPRRALGLIRNLPHGSAFVAAQQGGAQFAGWAVNEYLLAGLIDAVQHNTHAFVSAHSERRPKPPEPAYRPGKVKRRSNNLFAQMASQQFSVARKAKEVRNGSG